MRTIRIGVAVLTAAITILTATAAMAQPVNVPVNLPGNLGNVLNQKNSPLNPTSPNFGKFGKSSIPALPQPVPTTTNKTTTTPIGPGYTLPGQSPKSKPAGTGAQPATNATNPSTTPAGDGTRGEVKRVVLYDANGRPFASVDGDYFLDSRGKRVAVVHNDAVFLNAGSGAQIGWFTDGYLTDNDGKALATITDPNAPSTSTPDTNMDTKSATPLLGKRAERPGATPAASGASTAASGKASPAVTWSKIDPRSLMGIRSQ